MIDLLYLEGSRHGPLKIQAMPRSPDLPPSLFSRPLNVTGVLSAGDDLLQTFAGVKLETAAKLTK
jgi:hypothetical protein